jgi:hypothetical protein
MTKKTNTITDTCNNNTRSPLKQAANISLFKGSLLLSAVLYAFALTGCVNASQSATNTYKSNSKSVDSVMQEQIAKANVENQITDVYGNAADRAEYEAHSARYSYQRHTK